MSDFSLIIPIAADRPEYETQIPYLFRMDEDGIFVCIKSFLGLDLSAFNTIYITLLRKHDERYCLSKMLQVQIDFLGLKNVKICRLDNPTKNQAETIYQTIKQENIEDAIYVKDADGYFESEIVQQNGIAIFPIEKMAVLNPQNKSYVNLDDLFRVTNIIEKRAVSHYINAGGYAFENVKDFCRAFEYLDKQNEKLYLSHIVYSMLLDGFEFRPTFVNGFEDWGDSKLFSMHKH